MHSATDGLKIFIYCVRLALLSGVFDSLNNGCVLLGSLTYLLQFVACLILYVA
jgi:hypothetical protein